MALIDLVPAEEELNHPLMEKGRYDHTSPHRRAKLHNPELLEAQYKYFDALLDAGKVDQPLFEAIHVAVAQVGGCEYCASSHRKKYKDAAGLSTKQIVSVARGEYGELPELQRTVMEFTERVIEDPHQITGEDIDELREFGFDNGDLIQLFLAIEFCHTSTTLVSGLNINLTDAERDLEDV